MSREVRTEIVWHPAADRPSDNRRILIAGAHGLIKTGEASTLTRTPDGEPCYVCDERYVIHSAFAWAELPVISEAEVQAALAS
ncbi:MAG TPA: hypothetical protein VMD30_13115, partial [Tepidisphaeraceae bacterium]|nr:hypothetical protein [Tepidisphaeraceae bacterium]